jgi:hypothetical protein
MRIEGTYPTPVHGVSTLAPRNRMQGQAGVQKNFRSDPVNKLVRRNPTQWKYTLLEDFNATDVLSHSYRRDGREIRFLMDLGSGDLHCFVDDVLTESFVVQAGYLGPNFKAQSIEDTSYFINTDVVVEMTSDTDESAVQKVTHLNVTSALNYAETVQVNVTIGGITHVVDYTVPDLGVSSPNYDAADKARATKRVAQELAARINGGGTYSQRIPNLDYPDDPYTDTLWLQYCDPNSIDFDETESVCKPYSDTYAGIPGVVAIALGSSVAIWETGLYERDNWITVEVESGQGNDSVVAINQVIEKVTGLPLYAIEGTRITVKPDPTSEKGTYFLQAEASSGNGEFDKMVEVVWVESRAPLEQHTIDPDTAPFLVKYQPQTNTFTLESGFLKARKVGNDESAPRPQFIDSTISDVGVFQKRLVFLSGNFVSMSEVNDYENFWKQSALKLFTSDTVSVSSSAVGIDRLQYIVPHNRDLLIVAGNGQFKITGDVGIAPDTVAMALTTTYETQGDVSPVSLGNSVYFPIDYGDSTGLQEYTAQRNTTQDKALSITTHIVGYMKGRATKLVASPNLEMIVMQTSGAASNVLFVYEQFTATDGSKQQKSWSTWELSGVDEVLSLEFREDKLTLITRETGRVIRKEIDMYRNVFSEDNPVYIDDVLKLVSSNGLEVTLPAGYKVEGSVVVLGEDTDLPLHKIPYTVNTQIDTKIVFSESIGVGNSVYVGKEYESRYAPTRPFKYTEDGISVTTDSIRISNFILSLVDTNVVKMHILSPYYEGTDIEFNSRYLNGINNLLGVQPFTTGDTKFSFAQDAEYATAEFYCDNHLGCNIAGLSWEGQYFQSKGRL